MYHDIKLSNIVLTVTNLPTHTQRAKNFYVSGLIKFGMDPALILHKQACYKKLYIFMTSGHHYVHIRNVVQFWFIVHAINRTGTHFYMG